MSIESLAEQVVSKCAERGVKVTTAESCTGGLIIAAITSVSGSSAVTEMGLCSYSNRIKSEILGVSEKTLREHTEYSIQCAEEMARGALRISGADYAISTSGVAGPTGGTAENPVGTIYIAAACKDTVKTVRERFSGDREQIRASSVEKALSMLLELIDEKER